MLVASDAVADAAFEDPRLAVLYDPLDPVRDDLDAYAAMVTEFEARSVLDVGCGTGTFACMLARVGRDVVGVDPAAASLEVARVKPDADRVRWFHGDITAVPRLDVDLVTMTANVAQVFLTDDEWLRTLRVARENLRDGGRLVFETRDPERRAWKSWNKNESTTRAIVPGVGPVESWTEVTEVDDQLVTFQTSVHVAGEILTSQSTLRFRTRAEILATLHAAGFSEIEVRDAPDRPGLEFVFIAKRACLTSVIAGR